MFRNRVRELSYLDSRYSRSGAELAVLYGRRRVGKSTLLFEWCKDKPHLYFFAARLPAQSLLVELSQQIAEVTGFHGETISMHDIFTYRQSDVSKDGTVQGEFQSTGIQPQCLSRLKSFGLQLPRNLFEQGRCATDRLDTLRTK